jgi:pilus assembly protein Flp/PilA
MKDERGAVLTEYGILVALIAVVCTAAVNALGAIINGLYTTINAALVPAL